MPYVRTTSSCDSKTQAQTCKKMRAHPHAHTHKQVLISYGITDVGHIIVDEIREAMQGERQLAALPFSHPVKSFCSRILGRSSHTVMANWIRTHKVCELRLHVPRNTRCEDTDMLTFFAPDALYKHRGHVNSPHFLRVYYSISDENKSRARQVRRQTQLYVENVRISSQSHRLVHDSSNGFLQICSATTCTCASSPHACMCHDHL
jgi:hypothetical protein